MTNVLDTGDELKTISHILYAIGDYKRREIDSCLNKEKIMGEHLRCCVLSKASDFVVDYNIKDNTCCLVGFSLLRPLRALQNHFKRNP